MYDQMMVLLKNLAHLANLRLEVFVKKGADVQLGFSPVFGKGENAVFMELQGVKETQPGLGKALEEPLEIRLDHDEVQRTVEGVLEEHTLKFRNFGGQIVSQVLLENPNVLIEHRSQVFIFTEHSFEILILLGVIFERCFEELVYFLNNEILRELVSVLFVGDPHKYLVSELFVDGISKAADVPSPTKLGELLGALTLQNVEGELTFRDLVVLGYDFHQVLVEI